MKNKKLKKYIQKQIQKQVGADFAGFDNRVYDLEVKLGIKELRNALATIETKVEDPKQDEIDWSVQGIMLQNIEYPDVIVLYTGSHKKDSFNAVYLTTFYDLAEKGCYGSMPKKYFRFYNGSTCLKND